MSQAQERVGKSPGKALAAAFKPLPFMTVPAPKKAPKAPLADADGKGGANKRGGANKAGAVVK